MLKLLTLVYLSVFTGLCGSAQNITSVMDIRSLKHELAIARDDSTRASKMAELSYQYALINLDSNTYYGQKALTLSRQIKYIRGEARAIYGLALGMSVKGDFPAALELTFKALKIADDNNLLFEKSFCLNMIGVSYWNLNDFNTSFEYYKMAREKYVIEYKDEDLYYHLNTWIDVDLAGNFKDLNKLDSAKALLQTLVKENPDSVYQPVALFILGDVYFKLGNTKVAEELVKQSIAISKQRNDQLSTSDACGIISMIYAKTNQADSVIYYSKMGLASAQQINYNWGILQHCKFLGDAYEDNNIHLSLQYLKEAMSVNNELYGLEKVQALQKILAEQQERQRRAENERIAEQNRLKQYAFLAGLAILLIIAFILYRNNKQKQITNNVLKATLTNLKSTQSQLIQSEKMASLGELTAGIAHEIQNPLNFVNNFSEVSNELIDEMNIELDKGDINEAKAIASDVKQNLDKINHHGKRADAIVKGMLQHSQSSTGVKELTDINKLADEYLRLSYHGLRAKNINFNADFKTDFDDTTGKINIVPQDIGRVLLNLFNNAFYATNEKKKTAGENYKPVVSIETKKINNKVVIKVSDNGNGIPQNIIDKIFQPFFTTKPTGQGTGLGLSLSYDIVKAHGGEFEVETKEDEGSTFIIQLPVKKNF
jgi:two-component system NtrC family sensor kinase